MLVTVTGFANCNHGRRRKHRPPMDDEAQADELPGSRPDGERRVHMVECERIVAQILATMTPAAGELIRLVDLEERSLAEAAEIVGRRVELVKRQHARAVERFEALALQYFCRAAGGRAVTARVVRERVGVARLTVPPPYGVSSTSTSPGKRRCPSKTVRTTTVAPTTR